MLVPFPHNCLPLFQDGEKLIRLWIHEVYRVFGDRLIDNEDKETFFGIVTELTLKYFNKSVENVRILSAHAHTHTQGFKLKLLKVKTQFSQFTYDLTNSEQMKLG